MLWLLLVLLLHLASSLHLVEVRAADSKTLQHMKKMTSGDSGEAEESVFARSSKPGVWIARQEDALVLSRKQGLRVHVDGLDVLHQAATTMVNPYEGYTTHADLLSLIRAVAEDSPEIARSIYLGRSAENREVLGLRLSRCPATGCLDKPSVAYMGPVHGNEVVGRELLVKFIDWVVNSPNEEASLLLDNVDMYIVPTLNPDGYEANTRENAHGIDLNRAFPDRCGTLKNEEGQWTDGSDEPEIEFTKQFILRYQPTATLWFHGGAEVISYPYNAQCNGGRPRFGYSAMAEDALLREFSANYASENPRMQDGPFGPDGGITNGADWYFLYGGHEDWTMAFSNRTVFAATAEVSDIKFPSHADLERRYWPANLGALARFPLSFVQGIHGRVIDKDTQAPLVGVPVYIMAHRDHAEPLTSEPVAHGKPVVTGPGGWYHRPVAQGDWDLLVAKRGYIGGRVHASIGKYTHVSKDFYLERAVPGAEHVGRKRNPDFLVE